MKPSRIGLFRTIASLAISFLTLVSLVDGGVQSSDWAYVFTFKPAANYEQLRQYFVNKGERTWKGKIKDIPEATGLFAPPQYQCQYYINNRNHEDLYYLFGPTIGKASISSYTLPSSVDGFRCSFFTPLAQVRTANPVALKSAQKIRISLADGREIVFAVYETDFYRTYYTPMKNLTDPNLFQAYNGLLMWFSEDAYSVATSAHGNSMWNDDLACGRTGSDQDCMRYMGLWMNAQYKANFSEASQMIHQSWFTNYKAHKSTMGDQEGAYFNDDHFINDLSTDDYFGYKLYVNQDKQIMIPLLYNDPGIIKIRKNSDYFAAKALRCSYNVGKDKVQCLVRNKANTANELVDARIVYQR